MTLAELIEGWRTEAGRHRQAQLHLRAGSKSDEAEWQMHEVTIGILSLCADQLEDFTLDQKSHKVMTPEEYQTWPIQGWHQVCRDVDGFGNIGVRFTGDPCLGAPETVEINGTWYDRRDTVDALNGLLADARKKIETYKGVIRDYRRRDLAANPTPATSSSAKQECVCMQPGGNPLGNCEICDPAPSSAERK